MITAALTILFIVNYIYKLPFEKLTRVAYVRIVIYFYKDKMLLLQSEYSIFSGDEFFPAVYTLFEGCNFSHITSMLLL